MAGKHGRRWYLQILLEPHRAKLLEELSEKYEKRMTAVAREIIYLGLRDRLPAHIYNEAKAKDEALWKESVRNRIEGRTRSRNKSKDVAENT